MSMSNVECYIKRITDDGSLLAIFVPHKVLSLLDKTTIFTPWEWVIQVGYNIHHRGDVVEPHYHVRSKSTGDDVAVEVLHVLSGKIKVTLFHPRSGKQVTSLILEKSDLIIMKCGHKVEYLEDSLLLQIKEGPYPGVELDKCYI